MGKNHELTTDERALLAAYERMSRVYGEPPTLDALAGELELPRTTVHYRLGRVRDKGFLTSKPITLVRPTLSAKGRRAL